MDEFDVTIMEADLFLSSMSGLPAVRLLFLPHVPCFLSDRVVRRLYCHISNVHPAAGSRRAWLRRALGMVSSSELFTDKELGSMIGRRIRVGVETVEFEGTLRLRVMDFLRYSGSGGNLSYSDNEYVFMIRELIQGEGRR